MPSETTNDILKKQSIVTNCPTESVEDAVRRAGRLLVDAGYVTEPYVEGMLARERDISTAMGNFFAIPHGTQDHRQYVVKTGLAVLTYPQGLDWNGETVKLVIGIASNKDEHIGILQRIAEIFMEEEAVSEAVANGTPESLYALMTSDHYENA